MRKALLALLVVGVLWIGLADGSINDLPGFSDATGPQTMTVESFERLDSGCIDAISDSGHSQSGPHGRHEYTSVIETGSADAPIAVWTERTSPPGADLSTFRVHVESHGNRSVGALSDNSSCETGVKYRLVLNTSDRGAAGILPDEHGVRILRLENGKYAGCSAGYTGGLNGNCQYPIDGPTRAWASAS
jgi:hypothetical protein